MPHPANDTKKRRCIQYKVHYSSILCCECVRVSAVLLNRSLLLRARICHSRTMLGKNFSSLNKIVLWIGPLVIDFLCPLLIFSMKFSVNISSCYSVQTSLFHKVFVHYPFQTTTPSRVYNELSNKLPLQHTLPYTTLIYHHLFK